ncbi:MAG TPA: hypothetical protein VMS31_11230 [Pyrinomonadaceae bacterium]|nr:hypothetical protein [Pyrinomonadaceae bacterium]
MGENFFLRRTWILLVVFIVLSISSRAQSFSSGSTGADGALDLTTGPCQREIQLPESGILNYTSIIIPGACSVRFKPNFRNTPAILLVSGSVSIEGTISLSALFPPFPSCGTIPAPGAGGFYGGAINQPGGGAGGGRPAGPLNGKWVGSLSLVPIVGGSGGAGGSSFTGGSGGGAIVIASSGTIGVSGVIVANGSRNNCAPSGGGAGGAIRLVANSITVTGTLSALGDTKSEEAPHPGVIRIEAPAGALFFTGSASPLPLLSTSVNAQVVPGSSTPSLTITSVGGFPISYAAGRPDFVDLILPNLVTDPISVVVQAHNIPVGTQVNLNISGPSSGTFTPGTLSGTEGTSATTIAVSGLSRTGATYLIAFADFTLLGNAANLNKKGSDAIATVRVIAKPGADSRLVFLRKNGTEIGLTKIPKRIRQQFGLD